MNQTTTTEAGAVADVAAIARPTDDSLDPHLPEYIQGAKRCGIQRSVWLPSFFVGWSPRNDNENAEGPWSDWVALAHAILAADAAAIALTSQGATASDREPVEREGVR